MPPAGNGKALGEPSKAYRKCPSSSSFFFLLFLSHKEQLPIPAFPQVSILEVTAAGAKTSGCGSRHSPRAGAEKQPPPLSFHCQ